MVKVLPPCGAVDIGIPAGADLLQPRVVMYSHSKKRREWEKRVAVMRSQQQTLSIREVLGKQIILVQVVTHCKPLNAEAAEFIPLSFAQVNDDDSLCFTLK